MRMKYKLSGDVLQRMYAEGKSAKDIANFYYCSEHKVRYWMKKFNIQTRSISEAIYIKNNPNGDPFVFRVPTNLKMAELFGMGIGLYWGEGTKANKDSVRLGNTDPKLISKFIEFLINIFNVNRKDFKFGLQIFSDISKKEAMDFWIKKIKITKTQFYKPTLSPSQSMGTYRKKSQYGVLTVYYHNKKLRDLLVKMLPM